MIDTPEERKPSPPFHMRSRKSSPWAKRRLMIGAGGMVAMASAFAAADLSVLEPPADDWESNPPPTLSAEPPEPKKELNCTTVQIWQRGKEIKALQTVGGALLFEVAPEPFRITIPSADCRPSIGRLPSMAYAAGVAPKGLIATLPGYEIVGLAETVSDLSALRKWHTFFLSYLEASRNPTAVRQHLGLCEQKTPCPNLVKAARTYWPFRSPETQQDRSYADFSPAGLASEGIVIYTEVDDQRNDGRNIKLLQAIPIMLNFNQTKKPVY